MRRSRIVALTLGGLGVLAGCVDLFHSTDFPTLCEVDAAACDAGADAPAGPIVTDFCTWKPAEAASRATEACARLAACDTPVGNNSTGACIANATLAYDCLANPNYPVKHAAHDYWDHLWQAKTCDEVDKAIFGGKANPCAIMPGATAFTLCDRFARVDCEVSGSRLFGESCAASGRTCDAVGSSSGDCTGTDGHKCTSTRCQSTRIHVCANSGVDNGFDCASFGAGTCTDSDAGGGPACDPSGTTTACVATPAVSCEGNVAVGCPTGLEVRVDCTNITGRCTPNALGSGNTFDVSRACTIPKAVTDGGAGGCTDDLCQGAQLVACVRGAQSLPIDCAALKLGGCQIFTTADGPRAACTPPQ